MVDLSVPAEVFIYVLDLLGTAAFAVTGAVKAVEHKGDIFGIIVLATVVGVAGGVTRDVIFGRFPNSFSDPIYVGITVAIGVATFFLFSQFKKRLNVWLIFDAVGLGVFSVVGATIAYEIVGLSFLPIVFGGMITAIGGGILRDIIVRDIPIVFVKEIYAVASLVGILVFYLILSVEADLYVATIVGLVVATGLRLVAMKLNWNLPRVKENS
ncbi:MAG: trimeric intracellular cation channel family protein [Thaumarchaeota archaeon]|nr:trimeric intracellular cation channel family protein [Nitrososphaerota archaeon]